MFSREELETYPLLKLKRLAEYLSISLPKRLTKEFVINLIIAFQDADKEYRASLDKPPEPNIGKSARVLLIEKNNRKEIS